MRAFSIEPKDLEEYLQEGDEVVLIDIRHKNEKQWFELGDSIWIPEIELPLQLDRLFDLGPFVLACDHGKRSLKIAEWLGSLGLKARFLAGGVTRLRAYRGK